MRPVIAIVGRPNVGKSTLLNRLSGRNVAIVDDTPGVTRDRIFVETRLGDRPVILVDTGGFDPAPEDALDKATVEQAQMAIDEADFVLFVCNAAEGLHPVDQSIANLLRRGNKPTLCLVNKSDPGATGRQPWDFYKLGLDLVPVSAAHGTGLTEMSEQVASRLEVAEEAEPGGESRLRLCVLGRPNVGKSSLCNALMGQDRQMVSSIPGTTRDAVDMVIERDNIRCLLVDTPGVRRKRSVTPGLERLSVVAALRSLERAKVAMVVLDAGEEFCDQDARLLRLVHDRCRGLVVVVNKIDLWDDDRRRRYLDSLKHGMRFVAYAQAVHVSAKTGKGVKRLLPAAQSAFDSTRRRIPTSDLNQFVSDVSEQYQPAMIKGRRAKVYYITQVSVEPPTFVAWVNDPKRVPLNYKRFLDNRLRKRYAFPGAPLRWLFKGKNR